jgi:hypothetical protein
VALDAVVELTLIQTVFSKVHNIIQKPLNIALHKTLLKLSNWGFSTAAAERGGKR